MDATRFAAAKELTLEQIREVERNAAHELARRSTPSVVAYAIAMVVLLASSTYASDHPLIIYTSISLFAILLSARVLLLVRFEQTYDRNPVLWNRIRVITLIGNSLVWGAVSSMAIYYYQASWTPLIAAAATAAICSGGILSIGIDKRCTQAHVLVILIPNIITSFLVSGYGMVAYIATYLVFCLFQIRYVNDEYWNARITAIKLDSETRQRLHNLTYLDPLTGLPNRGLLNDRLQQAILDSARRNNHVAVLFIGLDRFKQVNDTLGHQAGDELIKTVAQRINRNLRKNDTLARHGGDTFAMVLTDFKYARDVARIAIKINQEFASTFELNGLELYVTASIGIALYPDDAESADALMKNAEAAMYRVKENGGNNYQYFESSINTESMDRLQCETKLRRALSKHEFLLHYQPKIDLRTGKLSGFEALIRWQPENEELVPPFKFIPILEETGMIVPVGEWVLHTACKQLKKWHEQYNIELRMAVNLSARQLASDYTIDMVKRVLDETRLDAKYLELEITESMLIDNTEATLKILTGLHEMGVYLSIDDFGTGYSSLSYLKNMPIDCLKIDRSFVRDVTTDDNDAAVVETIIAMAHILDLKVVAEGSETIEQVKFLQQKRCDETQGFYFSKPLPTQDIANMIEIGTQMLSIDNLVSFSEPVSVKSN